MWKSLWISSLFFKKQGARIDNESNRAEVIAVHNRARIAVYDDLLAAPRVIDIAPQGVNDFIEELVTSVYELARQQGGQLPYTVIREIAENFIHAGFAECTVSVLDCGNTLRFADQGPGIEKKDLVLQPGVSSATDAMKNHIRGVGSGFPLVREYLLHSNGFLSIEDNAVQGTVITLARAAKEELQPDVSAVAAATTQQIRTAEPFSSLPFGSALSSTPSPEIPDRGDLGLEKHASRSVSHQQGETLPYQDTPTGALVVPSNISLNQREKQALLILSEQGVLGPVDLARLLDVSAPTTTRLLQKLEGLGMIESTPYKKRILSNAGLAYVQQLLEAGRTY